MPYDVTTKIEGEQYPTSNLAIPLMNRLRTLYKSVKFKVPTPYVRSKDREYRTVKKEEMEPMFWTVCDIMIEQLNKRIFRQKQNKWFYIMLVLDWRNNIPQFCREAEDVIRFMEVQQTYKEELSRTYVHMPADQKPRPPPPKTLKKKKLRKNDGLSLDDSDLYYGNLSASDTDSDVADSGHQDQCVETAVHKEVEIFQKIARSCRREAKQAAREGREYTFDLLDWYHARRKILPIHYILARKGASVMATEANCERVFSCGGEVLARKRNSMGHDAVEMAVFVPHNQKGAAEINTNTIARLYKEAKAGNLLKY